MRSLPRRWLRRLRRARCDDGYWAFLDAFDQHLTLSSVFERQFDLVAFISPEDCLAERRTHREAALFEIVVPFGQPRRNPLVIIRKYQHDFVAKTDSLRRQNGLSAMASRPSRSIPRPPPDGVGPQWLNCPVLGEPPSSAVLSHSCRAARSPFASAFRQAHSARHRGHDSSWTQSSARSANRPVRARVAAACLAAIARDHGSGRRRILRRDAVRSAPSTTISIRYPMEPTCPCTRYPRSSSLRITSRSKSTRTPPTRRRFPPAPASDFQNAR